MIESLERLAEQLGERAQRDQPLAPHTSMRVGGPADLLVTCHSASELAEAIELARKAGIPWQVLGGGCNILVADAGVRGLVVLNRASDIRISAEGQVWAESGAQMTHLARQTVRQGLEGLAWATGLPGTVGGAVVGNAGAFGGDVASVLVSAQILERDGSQIERSNDWFAFVYRGSRIKFTPEARRPVLLSATFQLSPGDPDLLRERADGILAWRRERHPSGATMGSTFKNAPDAHAGRVIEGAGLKGYRIGGVEVSEQHANFLINTGGATAADVLALIHHIQEVVDRQLGVQLEPEIELVGDWNEK